jgi:hypothetical protein
MVIDHTEPYELHLTAMFGDLRNSRNNENVPSIPLSSSDFKSSLSANNFSIACIRLERTYGSGDFSKDIVNLQGGILRP